jgi:transketolase
MKSMSITDEEVKNLEKKAEKIRETIIEMLVAAGSGHTAGPLGMADIFAAFYFHILHHDPKNPDWAERDRLILSNGHIVPVRYATMAHAGYFPVEECLTLRKFGSRLQGHPERERLPGLETTSGPLGEGLSQGNGIATAFRMNAEQKGVHGAAGKRVYVLMGDGEQDEGNVWEAVMWAGKNKLHNLTAVIDRNNIQIDGMTEDIMPLESLRAKYEAFNWHVIEVDGHNIRAFIDVVEEAKAIYEKPTVIIAHTIPGKGVPEIEFDYRWHGVPPGSGPDDRVPKEKQAEVFLRDIRTMKGRVPGEYA